MAGTLLPNQVNPPFGYGIDLSCISDLDPAMVEVSGRIALAQACVRRLQTPRGGLLEDPNYGYDIIGEIDGDMTSGDLARVGAQVDAELQKDERVLTSTTAATLIAPGLLVLNITLQDQAGPFRLVLSASAVAANIQILQAA